MAFSLDHSGYGRIELLMRRDISTETLLIIVVVLFLLGGGGWGWLPALPGRQLLFLTGSSSAS